MYLLHCQTLVHFLYVFSHSRDAAECQSVSVSAGSSVSTGDQSSHVSRWHHLSPPPRPTTHTRDNTETNYATKCCSPVCQQQCLLATTPASATEQQSPSWWLHQPGFNEDWSTTEIALSRRSGPWVATVTPCWRIHGAW